MNTDVINNSFAKLIAKRRVHAELGIPGEHVRNARYRLKNKVPISLDYKLRLLQKSGWTQPAKIYSRAQLVDLLKFYKRSSRATKEMGIEYVIEKWERSPAK